jgi:hypothetical protein
MYKKQGKVFMKQLFKEKYLKSSKYQILKIKWSSKNKIFSKVILLRLAAHIVTKLMSKKVSCRQLKTKSNHCRKKFKNKNYL